MDSEGVRVLAQHLAKVKLRSEETIYELKKQLKDARRGEEEAKRVASDLDRRLQEAEARIIILESDSAIKQSIEERNDWKALVAALNKDRSRIQKENEKLIAERDDLANERDRALEKIDRMGASDSREESKIPNADANAPRADAKKAGRMSPLLIENRRLRMENQRLMDAAVRSASDGGAGDSQVIEKMLAKASDNEELCRLRQENQGLRGQILHQQSNRSRGLLADIGAVFRFCAQPPKERRVARI